MKAETDILPRGLLCERDAALWLGGVSVNFLRAAGIRRKVWGTRKLYDVRDLAAFRDGLPYETEGTAEDVASCDVPFSA